MTFVQHQEMGANRALDQLVAEAILSQSLEDPTAKLVEEFLPIWHELDRDTLTQYSPPLADRLAGRSEEGIDALVQKILRVFRK